MATASLPSVAQRPRSGFADVTETMLRGYRSASLGVTVSGFHLSFLMECGQVTHLSGPQSPQKGEKSGLKNNRGSLKKSVIWGRDGGWGAADFSMTLFALHPRLMKLDKCSQFSDEPAGAQAY